MKHSPARHTYRCVRGCTGNNAVCDLGIRLLSTYRLLANSLPQGTSLLRPEQMAPDVRWLHEQSVLVGNAYLIHNGTDDIIRKFDGGK